MRFFSALTAVFCGLALACSSVDHGAQSSSGRDPGGLAPAGSDPKAEREARALRGLRYGDGTVERDEPAASEILAGLIDVDLPGLLVSGAEAVEENRGLAAIEPFTRAVLLAPENPEAFLGLGRALRTSHLEDQATAAWETGLRLAPSQPELMFLVADMADRRGERQRAEALWRRVTKVADASDAALGKSWARLARLLHLDGRREEALVAVSQAKTLGASFPAALLEEPTVGRRSRAAAHASIRLGPEQRIDRAPGTATANEATQVVSTADPLVALGGWNDYREFVKTYFGITRDGGDTWSEVAVEAPAPIVSLGSGDPMTAADPRTGTLWAGGIAFDQVGGMYCARLDPGASAFEPSVLIDSTGGVDKGWMAAGPSPGDAEQTILYAAYNFGVARSLDMGDTWSAPVSLGPGVGFLPRVGSAGELYVAYWDFDDRHLLRRSFDGGVTFGPPITIVNRMDVYGLQINDAIPGNFRVPSFVGLAVDPVSGALNCVYIDTTSQAGLERNVDVYFTRSEDQGLTWSTPTVVNGDGPFIQDQFMPWIEADEQGGLHVVYLDTRNNAQLDADLDALVDAYYAYSDDGGASWGEFRLTDASWNSDDVAFPPVLPFIGDYIGMSVAGGRAQPVYVAAAPESGSDIVTRTILVGPSQAYCLGQRCPCGNSDVTAGCGNDGLDGDPATGARLDGEGTPSVAEDDLVLRGSGVAPGALTLLFAAPSSTAPAFAGGGRLCLGGTLRRYPPRNADSTGGFQVGPGEVVAVASTASIPFGPSAGETWYYQVAYRDAADPCGAGFNLTNAVSVLWE